MLRVATHRAAHSPWERTSPTPGTRFPDIYPQKETESRGSLSLEPLSRLCIHLFNFFYSSREPNGVFSKSCAIVPARLALLPVACTPNLACLPSLFGLSHWSQVRRKQLKCSHVKLGCPFPILLSGHFPLRRWVFCVISGIGAKGGDVLKHWRKDGVILAINNRKLH